MKKTLQSEITVRKQLKNLYKVNKKVKIKALQSEIKVKIKALQSEKNSEKNLYKVK